MTVRGAQLARITLATACGLALAVSFFSSPVPFSFRDMDASLRDLAETRGRSLADFWTCRPPALRRATSFAELDAFHRSQGWRGLDLVDPWGGRYELVLSRSRATVRSAGPDGEWDTDDDVAVKTRR